MNVQEAFWIYLGSSRTALSNRLAKGIALKERSCFFFQSVYFSVFFLFWWILYIYIFIYTDFCFIFYTHMNMYKYEKREPYAIIQTRSLMNLLLCLGNLLLISSPLGPATSGPTESAPVVPSDFKEQPVKPLPGMLFPIPAFRPRKNTGDFWKNSKLNNMSSLWYIYIYICL